jgi:SSS family solute:Na+ symporter
MTSSTIALTIIFGIVALGSAIGFYAGTRQKMSLEHWTVGSRGFGTLLMWLLMAGESYTTFSVLGASGWVYSRGGPALYILAYLALANVVSFFVMPHTGNWGARTGCRPSRTSFACATAVRTSPPSWPSSASSSSFRTCSCS